MNTIGDYLTRRNCNLYKCKFYIDDYLGEELYSDNHHFKCSYCEICEHYYNEVHHFAYCDIIESDEDGHYVICNDCGYTKIRRR